MALLGRILGLVGRVVRAVISPKEPTPPKEPTRPVAPSALVSSPLPGRSAQMKLNEADSREFRRNKTRVGQSEFEASDSYFGDDAVWFGTMSSNIIAVAFMEVEGSEFGVMRVRTAKGREYEWNNVTRVQWMSMLAYAATRSRDDGGPGSSGSYIHDMDLYEKHSARIY